MGFKDILQKFEDLAVLVEESDTAYMSEGRIAIFEQAFETCRQGYLETHQEKIEV